eukprot:TRINITY_DN4270_c0_g2_i1.p1 TRINITY_DN4270_c0_g2~~TRINITY_DN4270_c0_g2_i1.p1  ORF type:complete len:531 (+),score=125.86 TRINITY_DN4270_c0_g2_i1:49-1641(+)
MAQVPSGLYYYTASARLNFTPVSPFSDLPAAVVECRGMIGARKALRGLASHEVVYISNCTNCVFTVLQNQRLGMVVVSGCRGCRVYVLDSAVIASRTCRAVACQDCKFVFEDCDVRKMECFDVRDSVVVYIGDSVLVEDEVVVWRQGCYGNRVQVAELCGDAEYTINYTVTTEVRPPSVKGVETGEPYITVLNPMSYPHNIPLNCVEDSVVEEARMVQTRLWRMVLPVLPGDDHFNLPATQPTACDIISAVELLVTHPIPLTHAQLALAYDEERVEHEDTPAAFAWKVQLVAEMLQEAEYPVFYTGAGISTSADIPDFRGPTGMWTMRDKGMSSGGKEFEGAHPTFAHYAITELAKRGLAKFVITTNMDGLHTRSGLPHHMIVELHGSAYKECCRKCKKFFHRNYDVCISQDDDHFTGNYCDFCKGELEDTIVNFSDTYRTPLDPLTAEWHSRKCDLAIVLGTSMNVQGAASFPLKVLRNKGGALVVVNLQHTPCDGLAAVRVYARTDAFMRELARLLRLPIRTTATFLP